MHEVSARLDWLIRRSGITDAHPTRRLNAIENELANLVVQWRPWAPIDPERELRMSDGTRDALLAWIEEGAAAGPELRARLIIYSSGAVVEPSVADGWIRVLLV